MDTETERRADVNLGLARLAFKHAGIPLPTAYDTTELDLPPVVMGGAPSGYVIWPIVGCVVAMVGFVIGAVLRAVL